MSLDLETLRKQVEKETVQGLSWDTAVQLLLIQGLTEVSSRLDLLNKVLAEILTESRSNVRPAPDFSTAEFNPPHGAASSSPAIGDRGLEARLPEPVRRGRPRKGT